MRLALALFLVAATPLSAQVAEDGFVAEMDAVLAPAGQTAPFLRCTGFFQAFRILAGADSEIGTTALERELDMAVLSTLLRQNETGAEQGAVMDEIRPLIAAAAELYADRLVANEAETGQVMDDGLTATLEVCSALRQQYLDALEAEEDG